MKHVPGARYCNCLFDKGEFALRADGSTVTEVVPYDTASVDSFKVLSRPPEPVIARSVDVDDRPIDESEMLRLALYESHTQAYQVGRRSRDRVCVASHDHSRASFARLLA